MKLSKTSWLILTAGILIVAVASLGIAHARQLEEHEQMSDNLTVAEMRLSKLQTRELSSQKEELEKQLSQITPQLETAKDVMHQTVESITTTDSLFEIAEACDVVVMDVSSSDISSDTLADRSCLVIALTARVEGDVSNLINFIVKLNTDFAAGVVKSADIDIPEATDEKNAEIPSARIQLVVHTYQGE